MNKLDIHEFLRIYLPGLFLSSIFVQVVDEVQIDATGIATLSIFIGLAFAYPAMSLSQWIFKRILKKSQFTHSGKKAGYWETWVFLYENAKGKNPADGNLSNEDASKIALTHYVRRYGSPELYSFRIQKTFGVLYFSLSLASLTLSIIPCFHLIFSLPKSYQPIISTPAMDIVALMALSGLFFHIAKKYFFQSLNMELYYWAAHQKMHKTKVLIRLTCRSSHSFHSLGRG